VVQGSMRDIQNDDRVRELYLGAGAHAPAIPSPGDSPPPAASLPGASSPEAGPPGASPPPAASLPGASPPSEASPPPGPAPPGAGDKP
jgi:hypothetical protein